MNLPKELTTVTSLSKILAAILFVALPFIGFFLGIRYQEMTDLVQGHLMEENLSITRIPTLTSVAIPTIDSSLIAGWQTYRNDEFGFEVKYPSHWKFFDVSLEGGYDAKRYSGEDGFFQFSATEDFAGGIDEISKYEAYFATDSDHMPYGSKPVIESLKIGNQEARLILPSDDRSKEMENKAGLIIRYPKPIVTQESTYEYLVLLTDVNHINQILSTFRFVE